MKAVPSFTSAEEVLNQGETGLFLFTNGQFFTINADKTGSSGFWNLDPIRKIDRVVIFRWSFQHVGRFVELFTALPNGFDRPMDEGPYPVRLLDIQHIGNTVCTWEEFVGTQQHPVTSTKPSIRLT
jgi:hypothetical protein